jgi:hypothetical protein
MVTYKEYTFQNVTGDHTISAEFEESTEPTPTGGIRMFIKQNGVWKPLFT